MRNHEKRSKGWMLAAAAVLAAAIAVAINFPAAPSQPGFIGAAAGGGKKGLTVALTFDVEDVDDANETVSIPAILELLAARNITSTFFVTGLFAENYPGTVRLIRQAGHEIGLHTYEHFFPIFSEQHAAAVAKAYGTAQAYVWARSYRSPEAFADSIRKNRMAIVNATGGYFPWSFRSPGLVTRWDPSDEFYDALEEAGVRTDSSVMQEFSSWGSGPAGVRMRGSVTEVPVTRGEDLLGNGIASPKGSALIERVRAAGLPVVIMVHPKNLGEEGLAGVDEMISGLESSYNVTFMTIASLAAQTASR